VAEPTLASLFGIEDTGQPFEPGAQTRELLALLVRRLFFLVLILGVLILPVSLLRLPVVGWHPSLLADMAGLVVSLLLLLFHRRLRPEFVGAGLLVTLLGVACVKLVFQGLASIATPSIMAGTALCAIFFSLPMAVAFLGAGLLLLAGIGLGVVNGAIEIVPPPETYLRAGWFWVANGAGLALLGAVLVLVISALRHRWQRALAESESRAREARMRQKLHQLIEHSIDDALFVQDNQLRIVYVSPSAEKLIGYTPEELLQMTMDRLMAPESLERALRSYAEQRARADDPAVVIPLMEYEYVRKDGSRFIGELRVRWLRGRDGKIVGCAGVLRDVTERRRAQQERRALEERLRQAEKMEAVGQLAGGIAHDFNNYLGSILGAADCLRLDAPEGSQSKILAELIVGAAQRAAELIRKLMVFSRRQEPRRMPLSARRLVEEAVALLRTDLPPEVAVRVEAEADLWIEGEEGFLASAILNLCVNARDAIGNKGEIGLSLRRVKLAREEVFAGGVNLPPGSYAQIGVADTGEGMSEETQRKLFTPFFTTKQPGKGTGLGLAAVFGVVNAHGGGIRVESRPGAGSRFEVLLPEIPAPADSAPAVATERLRVTALRIILVDDNPGVRQATRSMLELLGHSVVDFATAGQAITAVGCGEGSPDLVMMDVTMPDQSGIDAAVEIHRRAPTVRVLLVSGRPLSPEDARRAPANVIGFLPKPYSLADLEKALARPSDGPAASGASATCPGTSRE